MAKESYERDFDDEVYEDDYYDEHYEEEELDEDILDHDADSEDSEDSDDSDDGEDEFTDDDVESWENEKRIHLSFACEDCDYRWEDTVVKAKTGNLEDEEEEEFDAICPMCGSMNITQI